MEKLWYLKRCDLFEKLSDEEARRLDRHALFRKYRRGDLIYSPTELGRSVLLLASGRVKIKDLTPDGKETILAFIAEGEIFGELALVDDDARREYAEAVAACEVVAVPSADVLAVMERRPELALSVTKLIGLRRRRIENRLCNLLFLSSRDRLLRVLAELMDSHGERAGGVCRIRLALSHQELAGLIGVTRETVTVTLGQLQAEGLIRVQRRLIAVLDPERLDEEAGRYRHGWSGAGVRAPKRHTVPDDEL